MVQVAKTRLINDAYFAEIAGHPTLVGSKCKQCGAVFFPKKRLCTGCYVEDMELSPLSTRGKLVSYSISSVPFGYFEAPYAVGYVDLPEGIRLVGQLAECDNLALDMEVDVVIDKLFVDPHGFEVKGCKFRPVGRSG